VAFHRALELRPHWAQTWSNYLFFLGYQGVRTGAAYLAEARQWELHAVPDATRDAAATRRFPNPSLAGRKLRVGYVSGDFKKHPVSRFIRPLLVGHDRSRIEVHAFSTNGVRDDVTVDLCHRVDYWHEIAGLSDDQAVKLIAAYGIDVLVDLSGHTGGNRLGVFARRAAPVQCHYLGYFVSTGLSEMDYWIGDPILIPPDHDLQYSEAVWRLPPTGSRQISIPS
jgi:protein O-GlcNAc transferase